MDIRLALAGKPNLDDVRDIREIHSAGSHVGGHEDAGLAVAEVVSRSGALCLGQLGMNFEGAQAVEGRVALEAAAELVEDGSSKGDLRCAVEVDDGLERTSFTGLRGLVLAQYQLVERWHNVLEASNFDVLLGHTLVGGLLVLADALGEVEAGAHGPADEIDHVSWHGGREHEVLAFDFLWVGQVLFDVVDFALESVVQEAIGLVHDKCIEVGCLDARVCVSEDVVEAAGRAHEEMAALTLSLHEHGPLLGAAHGGLDHDAGATGHLLGLDGDLLCQFSGRRNDNGADVVCLPSLVSARPLGQAWVVFENPLDDGNEEAERLAGARFCLGNDVDAAQCLVDGACLDVGHGSELHLLGDGVDQVWVDEATSGQLAELGHGPI